MRHLRRPSQFIGLDRVARPSPPTPLQFYNFPIVVAPVDSAHGNRVFDDDPRRYLGHSGGVSSEWRRILVTDTISTIVQFRAIDYGMETCELHVDLPSQQTNSTSYPGHSISISLYRIDASFPVDTKTLSYDTRPARLFKIDDITMVVGNVYHWHHKFLCASEEVLSFELIRASFDSDYDCHVEWWQDRDGTGDGPGMPLCSKPKIF
ncbi:uncharacterized protein LAESUDRAFT_650360 [Laetiporus sulphureus 93-53]|uniref:Ubiquitin 3 binding protein But2 C-terminal domain-containing protein n=1 Tax=Laetiporus sulphureus 93-53 TaxID=1314785 RepID=A0A165EZ46_9APHY|nr:uncharacterized protein LAESUDRAFT_650360 [Laetiporus sulphureus 93-53]KZT08021.1 hypothetical protein LAESUDRAFT_650360 [Laetiporus sulphureus 93-53]